MSFATLPPWAVLAGVPLLAGAVYLLQRLRSQPRVVAFAAARLWAQVAQDPLLRVRGTRFRYRLAYALSLAIALLLWLAFAGPVAVGGAGARGTRIFYLDNAALMTGGDAFAAAKRALLADVRGVAPERRSVVLGDVTATRLLAPGESVSLLAARLDRVAAGVRPSTAAQWLLAQAAGHGSGRPLDVTYYGAWGAIGAAAGDPGVRLRYGYLAPPVPGNRGIVALGVSPAASGRWSKADLIVTLAGPRGWIPAAGDITMTRDGRPVDTAGMTAGPDGRFLLRDVDADGRRIEVALRRGDGFAADDRAAIRVPDRTAIRVALSPATPAAIRDVVARDDAFRIVPPDEAGVVVRRADETFGGAAPALILADAGGAPETFLFTGPGEDRTDLARRLDAYGLSRLDAPALADQLHRPISVDAVAGPTRSVRVWSSLFAAGSAFEKTAAMPLFVSQSLRWLAGEEGWIPYAKAGAPLPDQSGLTGWSATAPAAERGLGGRVFADDAGDLRLGGKAVAVALTDRATTAAAAAVPPGGIGVVHGGSTLLPPDMPLVVIGLVVLLLLAGEWVLFQRGRMP